MTNSITHYTDRDLAPPEQPREGPKSAVGAPQAPAPLPSGPKQAKTGLRAPFRFGKGKALPLRSFNSRTYNQFGGREDCDE